ncbi:MAG: Fic family protein [Flavobacteriales bacterium]|nr:Fic family protein [Flavobacteriales bacterium]
MRKSEEQILVFLELHPSSSSKEIHDGCGFEHAYSTTKRVLVRLREMDYIVAEGQLKGTRYTLSPSYHVVREIDLDSYFVQEIDDRQITDSFNWNLIENILPEIRLFSEEEAALLDDLQLQYVENIKSLQESQYKKELERLAIDLSWKSSQIEGNTYSLLETERLLKEKETAEGKTKDEATMLLNHKDALDFILENPDYLSPLEVSKIEDVHSILIKELGVDRNIRSRRVGISGTNYKPLDNEHQIREALGKMCDLVNSREGVFDKAFLLLLLLSYIQAFNDGNKRTARIVSNACLIHYHHCPISFRTVDSIQYKMALLIFYEQNNISAFKKIFIDQFKFAVETYF